MCRKNRETEKQRDRKKYKKYKIIGRIVATVHNITPRNAILFCFAYLRPKPLFIIIFTKKKNRTTIIITLYVKLSQLKHALQLQVTSIVVFGQEDVSNTSCFYYYFSSLDRTLRSEGWRWDGLRFYRIFRIFHLMYTYVDITWKYPNAYYCSLEVRYEGCTTDGRYSLNNAN